MTSLADATTVQDHRATPPTLGGKRPVGILVVDDEEAVRQMLAMGMRVHGFAVWIAANSLEALEMYRRHHSEIDVVLLDVRMPDRDGPETLVALRELDPNICFYFMSGDTGKYSQEDLLALGAMAVFWKPMRIAEVAREFMLIATPAEPLDPLNENRWEEL